jgi:hypothetical protein
MKDTPLKLYDMSVRMKWDIEKAAEYEWNIHRIIRHTEMMGKPLTIEYIDEDLNVVGTLKLEGDKKKSLEYESKMKKLLKMLQHLRKLEKC